MRRGRKRRHLRNASTACLAAASALGLPALVSLAGSLLIPTHAYGWLIFGFLAPVGFASGCSFHHWLHSLRGIYPLLISAGILALGIGSLVYLRAITLSNSQPGTDVAFDLVVLLMVGSGIYIATIGMLLIASGALGWLSSGKSGPASRPILSPFEQIPSPGSPSRTWDAIPSSQLRDWLCKPVACSA